MANEGYHASATYFPTTGQVFAGEHERIPAMNAKLLATYKLDAKSKRVRNTIPNAALSATAKTVQHSMTAGDGMALMAAEGVANSENLAHLQLIRLFPEAQAAPESYFYLEEAFVKREIPMLEFRETFRDVNDTIEYLDRMEESKVTKTSYQEIKYDLKKLVGKVYTPIEDIMRTIINPQMVDLENLRWNYSWKRNKLAIEQIKKITRASDGTTSTNDDVGDPKALASTGGVHSANRIASEINKFCHKFLKRNDLSITHLIWNTDDFATYTENTWTRKGPIELSPERMPSGGVVETLGLQGITSIVDLEVPAGTLYAINKPNALRIGEGPKIMRRYYDEEKDSEAIKMLDFVQFLSVDDQIGDNLGRNFAFKMRLQ